MRLRANPQNPQASPRGACPKVHAKFVGCPQAKPSFRLTMAMAAMFALLPACSSDSSKPPVKNDASVGKPNILLIVADDLGYSDIGAFGGEINTPNLDQLASEGTLLTNYYVGATCSPTRAMIMSGTDHHLVGLGSMAELMTSAQFGQPGYEGFLNNRALSVAELLRDGYHTYMAGKWHLGLTTATSPRARGFDRYFALLQGAGSHFAVPASGPTVADLAAQYRQDDAAVILPVNFYSSVTYTDRLISFIDQNRDDPHPFFAYLAYTAPHWPLQAPDADIARYAAKYDEGYAVIRQRRVEKQKALGIIPIDFQPSPPLPATPSNPSWEQLTADQRKVEARKMEVYAAMVENMDRNIGRLLQYLRDIGVYDNTLIFFQSDNGAEGAPSFFQDNANTDNSLANIGRPGSNVAYGQRWAEVSSTPFRLWKAYSTEGGIAAPAIVKMPGSQAGANGAIAELAHVSDLAPTFLELAGVADPGTQYNGRNVFPITGLSMLPLLEGRSTVVRPPGSLLAGELFGSRYVRRDQWKLVSVMTPYGDNQWELYDVSSDRAESNNVFTTNTDIASQLIQEWNGYEQRVGVIYWEIEYSP